MNIGDIMDIAVSGLVAQRVRLGVTASNLANAQTTRTAAGGPYRRRDPVFAAAPVRQPFGDRLSHHIQRVEVRRIAVDPREPIVRFDPGHPDADPEGYVSLPDVNPVEELANMISARRSYEASLLVMRKAREMGRAALQIGRCGAGRGEF